MSKFPAFSFSNLIPCAVIVEFQPSSYTVVEGEGMVRFAIVKRTLTTEDVTVQFTTHEGSATCEACYESYSN